MSRRKISAGSTSVTVPVFVQDTSSTTGAGLGSLVFNTAGLAAKYRREGQSAWTTITLATATVGTWASGGFIADGGPVTGGYELGVPDAVLAAGAKWAEVAVYGASNMLPVLLEFELDTLNYQAAGGKVPATVAAGDIAANAITAASVAASALNGKGDWLLSSGYTAPNNAGIASIVAKLPTNAIADETLVIAATNSILSAVGTPQQAGSAVTLPSIPTNWITASGVAASALNGKGDWLLAANYTAPPTSATISAAVWDLATSGHTGTGTFGAAMNAAGSAGDPWATSLPGPYGSGTAGNIVGAKLDAAVSSRSSLTTADIPTASAISTTLLDLTNGVETGLTLRQAMRLMAAALGGVLAGGGTTTITIKGAGVSSTRVTATVDASGNRSALALNL